MADLPGKNLNPYTGPRAFQVGEQIYGRQRETSQLVNLLIAERIVLLYSPSGAGKTSLIQAALIPRLTAMKFRLLPVVRLNLNLPQHSTIGGQTNRYVFSALISLEADLPPEQQLPHEQLAQMSLPDYLEQRPRAVAGPEFEVLIFDQFEEILILDPTDLQDKREFFNQLGQALNVPNRWALFSMREDFVAGLDPYVLPVPSRFNNRFRLDLLGQQAALQAIQQPAQRAGVEFEADAAEKLVDDLRRVRVQRPDGSLEPQLGPYVEPVQLQVVCYRLWDAPRPDFAQIREEDLATLGRVDQSLVDQSLAEYYAQSVVATSAQTGVSQRAIRTWFDRHLITEQSLRGTVLMSPERSADLDNQAIRLLINAHLVRAEKRGGSTWFELAHDRLIGPVRADNAAWFEANLSLLQKQTALWDRQGHPESLLLRANDLTAVEQWANLHREELLSVEAEFLDACRALNEREHRARRLNRVIRILLILALILMVISVIFGFNANRSGRQAVINEQLAKRNEQQARQAQNTAVFNEQLAQEAQATAVFNEQLALDAIATAQSDFIAAQRSQAGQLAALSHSELEMFPSRSLLLAIEALDATSRVKLPRLPAAEESLRTALADPRGLSLPGHQDWVWSLAFSPDRRWLASGGKDSLVRLWKLDVSGSASGPLVLPGHRDWIYNLAISPDGHWLATASKDGTARLWDLQASDLTSSSLELLGHQDEVYALAFDPDGHWLATSSKDKTVRLWDLQAADPSANPQVLGGNEDWFDALAFSPDGRWLAGGSLDNTTRLWDLNAADPAANARVLRGHTDWVGAVAFSPDGRWLATGSYDNTARLWDMAVSEPGSSSLELRGHQDFVNVLAFSPDGRWLATGSGSRQQDSPDHTARLWDLRADDPSANPIVLRGHSNLIASLAFSPDGHWLATGSFDHSIRLWDLSAADPATNPVILRGHDDWVLNLAFSPDGRWLASGGADAMLRLWDLQATFPAVDPAVLAGHTDWVLSLAFSPDGRWLATGSPDKTARLWQVDPPHLLAVMPHDAWVWTLAFSPDGRWLATGSENGIVRLWDLGVPGQGQNPLSDPILLVGHQKLIFSLAFSPDGRWLATGSADGSARLWDLQNANPAAGAQVLDGHADTIDALAFSPDGRWLATGSLDGTARLWDMSAADPAANPRVLAGHEGRVNVLAFSPDGRWLATGSADRTARLWDLQAANPAAEAKVLAEHMDAVDSLAFSPDGRWLATGSADSTARLWDLLAADPGASSWQLGGHTDVIHTLAFSPDGRWLATGSNDDTIQLWELAESGPASSPVVLSGHEADVYALAFSPDGHWLASGSADHTARLWNLRLDELVGLACQNAGRNLSQAEWLTYFPGQDYRRTCQQWPGGW